MEQLLLSLFHQCKLLTTLEEQGRKEGEPPWVAGETQDREEVAEGSLRKRHPEALMQVRCCAEILLKLLKSPLTKCLGR